MRKGSTIEIQKQFLQRRHPKLYSQLYRDTAEGFTLVGRDPLEVWMNRGKGQNEQKTESIAVEATIEALLAKAAQNIESLSLAERRRLSMHWLDEVQSDEVERLFADIEDLEEPRENVNLVHNEVNRRVLLTADVVGITTTGLARDIKTLRNLRSKVIVCEEAAEVLEAHIISALMPGVEHFIQIGDHQQLRPQINNHSLSLESKKGLLYQLDRSQFERLATGQPGQPAMPVAQLNVQRRMRPEIAKLIRSTMYPSLQDHGDILDLPHVCGMRNDVFWLNHSNTEDGATDDGRVKSHSNEWEVDMTKALVRHLVRQGTYKGTDIAVLTPYSGQLHKLRTALNNEFDISLNDRDEETLAREGFESTSDEDGTANAVVQRKRLIESLRLATVDNFQGEEAKVVIVSLVRSNSQGRVGFLRTKNRINVLLSRAQHGMYLIGNADTYSNVPMWVDVREQLNEAQAVGEAFSLCCPRHKETSIQCAEPEDFVRFSPEGGCILPCSSRLDRCGHRCLAKCHSAAMHSVFLCPRPCIRRHLTCDHTCPKLCGEDCGSCEVLLNDVELPCGHKKDGVPCFRAKKTADIQCRVQVQKALSSCGHVVSVPCHMEIDSPDFRCPNPCKEVLECGHICPGSCSTCIDHHRDCKRVCDRPRNTCNHRCLRPCHMDEPCPPCDSQCEVR